MLVRCAACGSHVPDEASIEVTSDGQARHFCSARCADSEAGAAAPLGPLPELPRNIVVAVDGSGPSLRAVERAAALALASRGRVTLVHAVDARWLRALDMVSGLPGTTVMGLPVADLEAMLRKDAESQLERARRICAEAGVEHADRIEARPVLEALVEAAGSADLVVIGSRGLGAVSGAVLGSLSQRLLGAVDVPVLVVH